MKPISFDDMWEIYNHDKYSVGMLHIALQICIWPRNKYFVTTIAWTCRYGKQVPRLVSAAERNL